MVCFRSERSERSPRGNAGSVRTLGLFWFVVGASEATGAYEETPRNRIYRDTIMSLWSYTAIVPFILSLSADANCFVLNYHFKNTCFHFAIDGATIVSNIVFFGNFFYELVLQLVADDFRVEK